MGCFVKKLLPMNITIRSLSCPEVKQRQKFPLGLDLKPFNRYNLPLTMKKELHPTDYRPVVFQDDSAGFAFLTQSTAQTNDKVKWEDGKEYPLVKMHISSASHPFFTGEEKIIDTEGRVDRFKARFATAEKRKAELANKAKKSAARAGKKTEKAASKKEA
jgi:large subunit ribosomal protein L31